MYKYSFKRIMDFLIALSSLIILSPIFIIICVWIKLDSRGPIFFKQQRIGRNKKLFLIYKFRSMRTDTPKDCPTHLIHKPQRYITKAGRILRNSSMDELPQLFNILKGEMAIVGPRPALWNQKDLILERDKYNSNDIRPGLTGWAQIHGRDELDINAKARLDGIYMERLSFLFDIKIIFITVYNVLRKDGIVEGEIDAIPKRRR